MSAGVSCSDGDAPPDLAGIAASAEVVVFRSGLTDTRALSAWLDRRGLDYRMVTMGMGDAAGRERYRRLRDWTGWDLLPLVFLRGTCVGGADELQARCKE